MKLLKLSYLTFLSLILVATDCRRIEPKPPVITALNVTSGRANSLLIITGVNFNPNPNSNVVKFGDFQAQVIEATPTTLKVKVPNGSTKGRITIKSGTYIEAYSSEEFITTSFQDPRDNQEYGQTFVGTQWWMTNNLNWDTWEAFTKDYCYQDNLTKCDEKGRLYIWPVSSAFNINVCPQGWRLPSETDFKVLITNLGDSINAKTAMLANGSSGLDVLYTGIRELNGTYSNENTATMFWTVSEVNTSQAKALSITESQSEVTIQAKDKEYGFCVRCIKYQ
ncbi:MAG: IPT/TIG domain-containing protein [Raineya sp.]|jgi:uncharacterized protein (TIGR02145 family)|nr:IPT/TIG domain-containing protein [Raineya sp.]